MSKYTSILIKWLKVFVFFLKKNHIMHMKFFIVISGKYPKL